MFHFQNVGQSVAPEALGERHVSAAGEFPSAVLSYSRIGKRLFDIIAVLIGGLLILPLLIVLAVMVRRDGGPVFYTQKRIGRGGREFEFWKFRSMIPGAKEALAVYLEKNPEAAREWAITQKLKDDPRITKVGRLIRKTSLDELPQLWNVLKGDMSLVGPRPMMPEQKPLYPGRAYYALRPGLTGYWQVSDRNDCSFAERAAFDDAYARELSLATDIKTLLATVRAVTKGTGC